MNEQHVQSCLKYVLLYKFLQLSTVTMRCYVVFERKTHIQHSTDKDFSAKKLIEKLTNGFEIPYHITFEHPNGENAAEHVYPLFILGILCNCLRICIEIHHYLCINPYQ